MSDLSAPAPENTDFRLPSGVQPSKRDRAKQALRETGTALDTPTETVQAKTKELISPDEPADKAPDAPADNAPDGDDDTAPKKLTLADIAEQTGLDKKALYETEFQLDGASVSLGQMKDFYRANIKNADRLSSLDMLEVQHRSDRMTTIKDIDQLVKLLPRNALSNEYLTEVNRQAGQIAQRETEKLLQVMPELQDPINFNAARASMKSVVESYGLTGSDIDNIVDHRWIVALNDLAKLKGLQASAKAIQPDKKTGDSRPASANAITAARASTNQTIKAAKAGDRTAQVSAITNLIGKR